MKIYRYAKVLFIIISSFFSFIACGKNIKTFIFASPIIYQPIIDYAKNKYFLRKDQNKLTNTPAIAIIFNVSKFKPNSKDKNLFDEFIIIKYNKIKEISLKLFIKDKLISSIEIYRKNSLLATHIRELNYPAENLKKLNKAYYDKSKKLIDDILAGESFIASLPIGKNKVNVNLTFVKKVVTGEMEFLTIPYKNRFCFYEKRLENSALLTEKGKVKFSVSAMKKNIIFANVYNIDFTKGYDCAFYYNNGLKFYLPMIKGQFKEVTTWQINGKNKK